MKRVNRFENKTRPAKERGKTPMDAALNYLASKARTVREMERYLDNQHYGEVEVGQVVDRLIELNYLNDASYAQDFIRSRLAAKPISRRKLYDQLLAHELPKDVIDDALNAIPEERESVNALSVAQKYALQFANLPIKEQKERLMRRLLSRGFDFDDAKAAVISVMEDMEADDDA